MNAATHRSLNDRLAVLVVVLVALLVLGWFAFLLFWPHPPVQSWQPHKTVALTGEEIRRARMWRHIVDGAMEAIITVPIFLGPLLGSWWTGRRAARTGRLRSIIVWTVVLVAVWWLAQLYYQHSLDAPLEEPANPNAVPAMPRLSSREVWIQEQLAYAWVWMVGVVLPTFVMFAPAFVAEAWLVYVLRDKAVRRAGRAGGLPEPGK